MTSRSDPKKISWPNPKPVKKQRKDRIKLYRFSCERAIREMGPSGYVAKKTDSNELAFHAVAFIRAVLRHDPGNKSSEWVMTKFTEELRKYLA